MTLNNVISLFQNIATSHYQFKDFGFGSLFDMDGKMKPGLKYYLLWVVPLESTTLEFTKQRRFRLLSLGLVKKDLSNRDEVWSDTESCMDDVIKILRNESDDYELIGDPVYTPITEEYNDWVTGWGTEIVLQTALNSNYCDVPSEMIPAHDNIDYATVYDQNSNIIGRLKPGQSYNVIIASGIDEGGANQTYTIQIVDI